jgi:serine/threonine-protein kinase
MRELAAGTVVDDRYRIVCRLGSGGMADVYCAEDTQLGRRVALKVLYGRFAADAEFVERFRREASHAAGLQHQHIVAVYDRGEWDGTSYIAMEYVDGRTLKQIIQAEAPLEPVRAIDLAIQILRAARFAHRRGVIHRDLKPHNVIVDSDGRVKVTDFGIARAGASDMTQTGSIMGTAQYLSPEQAQGHAVTPHSDLYSVGICLYEMLTGRVPFEGDSAVTIALKQVNEAPVPPSHFNRTIPAPLEDAVLRALAKDPAERFVDADAFIAALEEARTRIMAGQAPLAERTTAFAAVGAGAPPVPEVAPPTALAAPYVEHEVVYEAPPPEPPPERRWPWALLLAVLAAGAIVAAVLLLAGGKKVEVPSVVKLDDSAAVAVLHRAGLKVGEDQVVSAAPRGTVISQDPAAGSRVKEGTTVAISVSQGPGAAQVPVVDGEGRRAARKLLTERGFEVREVEEPSETVPHDHVIRTNPAGGLQLDIGSQVTLVVSTGPPQVTVPDVVGDQVADARSTLRDAGFKVSVTERADDTHDPGTVLTETPAGGGMAPKGSSVALVVAKQSDQVKVPDVTGEQDTDAVRILSGRGFEVNTRSQDVPTQDGDGVVLSQKPSGGKKAKRGSQVTITVGRYVAPSTTTTPSPPAGPPGAGTGNGR